VALSPLIRTRKWATFKLYHPNRRIGPRDFYDTGLYREISVRYDARSKHMCAGSLLLRTHRYSNPKSTEPWVKGARERRGRITRWEKARIVRVIPTTRSRGSRLLLATYSSYNRGRVTADQACVATKARPGHRIEHTNSFFFNARGALASRCVWSRTPGGWPSLLPFRPMPGRPGCYAHGPLMGARGSVSLLCSDRGPRPSRAHARRRKCSIRGVRTPFLRCCCTLSLLLLALLPPRSRGGLRAVLYGTGCLLMCARVLCFFGEAHPARTCSIQFVPVTWPSSSTKSVTQRAPSMMAAA
jgi:hypothetical protein